MDNTAVFAEKGRVTVSDCPDLSVKTMRGCPCGILYDLRYVATLTSLCEMSVRDSSTCCDCHKFIVMGDNRTKNITVVHSLLIRRMLVNVLSDAGPQNAVFQPLSNDRCSASKADCVAVVDMCISASLSHVGHHISIFNSFVLCTNINFQYTAFGFQALQV